MTKLRKAIFACILAILFLSSCSIGQQKMTLTGNDAVLAEGAISLGVSDSLLGGEEGSEPVASSARTLEEEPISDIFTIMQSFADTPEYRQYLASDYINNDFTNDTEEYGTVTVSFSDENSATVRVENAAFSIAFRIDLSIYPGTGSFSGSVRYQDSRMSDVFSYHLSYSSNSVNVTDISLGSAAVALTKEQVQRIQEAVGKSVMIDGASSPYFSLGEDDSAEMANFLDSLDSSSCLDKKDAVRYSSIAFSNHKGISCQAMSYSIKQDEKKDISTSNGWITYYKYKISYSGQFTYGRIKMRGEYSLVYDPEYDEILDLRGGGTSDGSFDSDAFHEDMHDIYRIIYKCHVDADDAILDSNGIKRLSGYTEVPFDIDGYSGSFQLTDEGDRFLLRISKESSQYPGLMTDVFGVIAGINASGRLTGIESLYFKGRNYEAPSMMPSELQRAVEEVLPHFMDDIS